MKARSGHCLLSLLFVTASVSAVTFPGSTHAASNQYWNLGGTGGSGIWGSSPGDKNWNTTAGAASGNTVWPDTGNEVAVFQDAIGGTVTVFTPLQAAGIIQQNANYTIDAATITLVQDGSAANPFIQVQTGTLTIASILDGAHGLIKSGSANLVLTSANTYTGTTAVTAGTLTLNGSLASTTLDIAATAALVDATGGLDPAAAITNAGTLTVNTADTVASYSQDPTGTLAGSAALSVTGTAALAGGTVSGHLLGSTTSSGSLLVSGSLGGGALSVTGGTLTLTGTSTNSPVAISAPAALVDATGGLDVAAAVTNAGILTVNAADTVASYSQDPTGTLAGSAALSVTGTAALAGGTVSGHLLGSTTSSGSLLVSGSLGGGVLSVTGGTLTLTGTSTNSPVAISAPAALVDANGGLDAAAAVTNAGTLTVNTADTVASYSQDPTGTLAGSAALSVTGTAALAGGTVSGHLLGSTTSSGNLLVSGSLGGGVLSVTGGTLTLTGTSTNSPVAIAAPAALVDANGGLDPASTVTNAGTLTVNTADTVASYSQDPTGTLAGSAALSVTGTAALSGGTVSGHLLGTTTSSGSLLVSGSLGGGPLSVTGGTLTLTGTSTNTPVAIAAPAALVDSNGGLDAAAAVTNAGPLTVNAADTVASYSQDPTGTLAGSAALSVTGTAALAGGTVSGHLLGTTTSSGSLLVSGSLGGGALSVTGGTLTLTGTTTNPSVAILAPAALVDANGGLDAAAAVTNAGTLTVNTADTVASYSQDPTGTLAGSAALTVSGAATLKGGAITGSLLGNTINLTSGVLTQTGTLGTATTHLDIAAGATLVAAGTQRYSLLTTTGTGAATWQGILTNTATLAPGGAGGTGTLQVTSGNFTNAAGAVLKLDIAAAGHDLLATTGSANFGGTLDLNQVGTTAAAAFVPIHVVDAATYTGNFTTLTENLDGAVWFNPGNGDVIRIAVPQGSTLFGSTTNQTATWVALYDDVIDPGVTNVFANPGGTPSYGITSGIANGNNPDLLWALAASFTPTGLNANLLNHLSPEVYVGLADYATQATRTHQRSAFSAPALAPAAPGKADSKGGSKDAAPAKQQWELFAAADYFNVRSAGSQNQADYELSDSGILAGVRGKLTDHSHVAAYLAADTGNIDGALIHADSTGWSLGLLGEATLDEATTTRLSAGISYGRYSFDGTRNSAAAGSSGWIPATAGFSNATADSLELFVGVEGLAYHNDHIRLIPAFGLRAACGTMNSFSESNYSTAGSPIALAVAADHYNSALAELSLRAEADLTHKLGLSAEAGLSAGIGDDPHTLTARFAKGSRAFQASADGISNDNIFLGLGATYKVSDSISVALGYRAEFRSDAGTFNGVHLASSFRF